MYFEGPEKKLELYCPKIDFFSYPEDFWYVLVESCKAQIIKKIENNVCKAYLLSESSLFVWRNRILMITCGRTELVRSAHMIVEKVKKENVAHFFFERKNEYYPEYQNSFVLEDFKDLKKLFPEAQAVRFGDKDDHHLNIFEYGQPVKDLKAIDNTLEVLMYGVCDELSEMFLNPNPEKKDKLSEIICGFFPDYEIDEHWFEPCGYSMNALKAGSYGTIHVTPEKDQNYISFELNDIKPDQVQAFIDKIYSNFKPRSYDIVYYDSFFKKELELNKSVLLLRQKRFFELKSGYRVSYYHWSEGHVEKLSAEEIKI